MARRISLIHKIVKNLKGQKCINDCRDPNVMLRHISTPGYLPTAEKRVVFSGFF